MKKLTSLIEDRLVRFLEVVLDPGFLFVFGGLAIQFFIIYLINRTR